MSIDPVTSKEIRSANWHITTNCNYRCKFCFAKNLGKDLIDIDRIDHILRHLHEKGIEKLNLVGGEPQMHPLFETILIRAKGYGFRTSMVTNGSLLNREVLDRIGENLDWIGLSIDSASDEVEVRLGRGKGHHVKHVRDIVPDIRSYGIKIKINTVVTRPNFQEDLKPLVNELRPQRWKVFQYLHISGNNDEYNEEMIITDDQFELFIKNNEGIVLDGGAKPIFEKNEDMVSSYLMISPSGDLILNANYQHSTVAWKDFENNPIEHFVNADRYQARGGSYQW